jgi:molybdate transport system substrate-binding protein
MRSRAAGLLLPVTVVAAVACGSSSAAGGEITGTVSVFAAASLTDAFNALGQAFHQANGEATVRFNFAGTPTLVTQIEQGASADVLASADTTNMDRLKADGFIAGTPDVFAHNQLEIVVGPGNPKGIHSLADLAKPGVIYISEAATVPAGKYSVQALQKAGVKVTPKSLETDVKSVVSKVELGEADAGIVYTTDVIAARGRVQGIPIPDQYNVVATYPIAEVKGAANGSGAHAFIDFVLSHTGQATLASFGFQPA